MKSITKLLFVLVLFAILLFVAGCGDCDDYSSMADCAVDSDCAVCGPANSVLAQCYNTDDEDCCYYGITPGGAIGVHFQVFPIKSAGCCGDGVFSKATQGCCGGTTYTRKTTCCPNPCPAGFKCYTDPAGIGDAQCLSCPDERDVCKYPDLCCNTGYICQAEECIQCCFGEFCKSPSNQRETCESTEGCGWHCA